MKLSTKSAFSLIELSFVILIIGILIAGITQSNRVVKKYRLGTARSLTQSSPVISTKDLLFWYETSMESSFAVNEARDNTVISSWNDINPQTNSKNHAVQSVAGNKPKYYEDVFNGGIPGIRFDGTDDLMTFDGTAFVNSDYTIFVVEQRRDGANDNFFISGTTTATNANLILGYQSNLVMLHAHYANDITFAVPTYLTPVARIHTFRFSQITGYGKSYWENGGLTSVPDAVSLIQTAPISGYTGASLGRYTFGNYCGDIAEVIAFNRHLSIAEKQAIETYLSKKYSIKIS